MAIKTYPVDCECGATIHVPGSAAGTTFHCQCGRNLEIPSLAQLKSSIGQAVMSADLELEHLVASNALPIEKECVLCDMPTDNQAAYIVVCERPEDKGGGSFWYHLLFIWFSPLLYMIHLALRQPEVHGRNVVFRIPVRVCEECTRTLTTAAVVREAMCETPVYARLFDKFPDAAIRNAD